MLMAAMRYGRLAVLGLALFGFTFFQAPAKGIACPFCGAEGQGPTLVGDFNQAAIVLVGTFSNAQRVGGNLDGGTTDFTIEKRLKDHDLIKGKNVISLPRYLPPNKSKFIIFCDVYQNTIDPYRGVEVPEKSDLVDYLTQALKHKNQPIGKRLRLCFDYLNSTDLEVSMDAYREFARADYNDYKDMAKALPADKAELIARWLQDPKTPTYRYGLYASLLGLCGNPQKHGDLLRSMVEDPKIRMGSGIEGLMAGMMMLQPTKGWTYLEGTLKNESEEFLVRYACLTTLRFFWSTRPDVFKKKQLTEGVSLVLKHSDMADFAIEDLRKWHCWEMTPRVLELFGKESHNLPVVRRSIMRFALQSDKQGNNKEARAFVAEQRRLNAEWVDDTNALLQIDLEATPVETKTIPAKK